MPDHLSGGSRSGLIENPGNTCIIATPFDARYTVCQIIQAIPIAHYCVTDNLISFHLNDYIDDVREKMGDRRDAYYPVLDENEKVVGMLSRYHLMKPKRKQVVLVDHNEMSQSVPGLNQITSFVNATRTSYNTV